MNVKDYLASNGVNHNTHQICYNGIWIDSIKETNLKEISESEITSGYCIITKPKPCTKEVECLISKRLIISLKTKPVH